MSFCNIGKMSMEKKTLWVVCKDCLEVPAENVDHS